MADETIPRCDNPKCRHQKQEGNNWHMGSVEILSDGGVRVIVNHYDARYSHGEQTWCSIPCIQQVIGKALDKPISDPGEAKP